MSEGSQKWSESCQKDFEKKLAQYIKENSKSFYTYVRSKQTGKDAVRPLKNDDGDNIPPGQETANALNKFFASVFTVEEEEVPTPQRIFKGLEKDKLIQINERKIDLELLNNFRKWQRKL